MRKFIVSTVIFTCTLMSHAYPTNAQSYAVPTNLQAALFYKIFAFDRNLVEKETGPLTLAILYKPGHNESISVKNEIRQAFQELSSRKIAKKVIVITEIESIKQINNIDIVYVSHGFEKQFQEIVKSCNQEKIMGISGITEYAQMGLAITIGLNKENKPIIVINAKAAKTSGIRLSSQIMTLAKII